MVQGTPCPHNNIWIEYDRANIIVNTYFLSFVWLYISFYIGIIITNLNFSDNFSNEPTLVCLFQNSRGVVGQSSKCAT